MPVGGNVCVLIILILPWLKNQNHMKSYTVKSLLPSLPPAGSFSRLYILLGKSLSPSWNQRVELLVHRSGPCFIPLTVQLSSLSPLGPPGCPHSRKSLSSGSSLCPFTQLFSTFRHLTWTWQFVLCLGRGCANGHSSVCTSTCWMRAWRKWCPFPYKRSTLNVDLARQRKVKAAQPPSLAAGAPSALPF